MKMILTFTAFAALTSNSESAGFPIANVVALDPFARWIAGQYAVPEFILVDLGAATVLDSAFLNQCNFPQCTIEGHATNSWASPSFSKVCDLVKDDADNRKGFFDITGFNYRWLRITIADLQPLDNAETVPAVGNLIIGKAVVGPIMKGFSPELNKTFDEFTTDNGSFNQTPKYGRGRHIIQVDCQDTLVKIRAFPKNWTIGVFFADLGYVDEAYLVFPPKKWTPPVRNILDTSLSFELQERP